MVAMGRKHDCIYYIILPFFVLVLLHLVIGLPMKYPKIIADEFGYLGNAQYLAGTAPMPDLRGTAFYHFGYSIFIIPAFWLFSDPLLAYKTALIINAFLLSTLYLAIYYIAVVIFVYPKKVSSLVAFVTSLYPSFLLGSNLAMSENVFIPLYVITIAVFSEFLRKRSYLSASVFGICSASLYAVHPRALPIVVISFIYVCGLVLLKRLPKLQSLVSLAVLVTVFWVIRCMNQHLQVLGWPGGREITGAIALAKLSVAMNSSLGLKLFVLESTGQLLYLFSATYGLFPLGVIFVVRYLASYKKLPWKQVVQDFRIHTLIFFLITSAGVFMVSSIFLLHGNRGDHFIYGRYNEGVLALYIAFALFYICRDHIGNRLISNRSLAIIFVMLAFAAIVVKGRGWDVILSAPVIFANVLGLYLPLSLLGQLNIVIVTVWVILCFTVLMWSFSKSYKIGLLLLAVLFLSTSSYATINYLIPFDKNRSDTIELANFMSRTCNIEKISYDYETADRLNFFYYQYLLPEIAIEKYSSVQRQTPLSPVIIVGSLEEKHSLLKDYFLFGKNNSEFLLVKKSESESLVHFSSPKNSFIGVTLGATRVDGIFEYGFHDQEYWQDTPVRWTAGDAILIIPLKEKAPPPLAARFVIGTSNPEGTTLKIEVNGIELFSEHIPQGEWLRKLPLTDIELHDRIVIFMHAKTFTPADISEECVDKRQLGVYIKAVELVEKG